MTKLLSPLEDASLDNAGQAGLRPLSDVEIDSVAGGLLDFTAVGTNFTGGTNNGNIGTGSVQAGLVNIAGLNLDVAVFFGSWVNGAVRSRGHQHHH